MESNGWFIISLIALVALSAFFSASETAYTSLNRARLKSMAAGGDRRAERALRLSEDYDRLLSGILVGNNIVNILSASLATRFRNLTEEPNPTQPHCGLRPRVRKADKRTVPLSGGPYAGRTVACIPLSEKLTKEPSPCQES